MSHLHNLPEPLQETGLFCLWKYEKSHTGDKPKKVPYNPRTGNRASAANPGTFAPFSCVELIPDGYDGAGVGIFNGLGAIDIDNCIDENGEFSEMAQDVIQTMTAYTEYSPSGTGVHILFRADLPQYDKARYYENNRALGLEVYVKGGSPRYLTVTGKKLCQCADLEERSAQVQQVLDKYMLKPVSEPAPQEELNPVDLSDDEIVERICKDEKFKKLWYGDYSEIGSWSEADLSLCNKLAFWTNKDPERMDRIFRRSGLMRGKWDEQRGSDTYGAMTINKAVSDLKQGYDPEKYRQQQVLEAFKPVGPNGFYWEAKSVRPNDFSDAGNAKVFARVYRGELIYTDSLGWLWWTGQKWDRDDHMATAFALELSEKMLQDALTEYKNAVHRRADAESKYAESGDMADEAAKERTDKAVKEEKAYLSHANKSRNAPRLRNMLGLSKPALAMRAAQLDANPLELNTPAGIVDLTTGNMRPHDRLAYCSKSTVVAPGENGAQMWSDFLDTITSGDPSVKGFLQMVAGMALFGTVYHEGIILAYGGGRNGKSTFFNALGAAVGDYAGTLSVDSLTTSRNGNQGASLATLRGKRLVITGELEEYQRLSPARLKQLASTDTLRIEEKYRAPEDIIPSHTIVLFTNHLPRVGSTDNGTWRRLTVVPFNATIPVQNGVANYGEVLAREAGPSILSWAIAGAVRFARNQYKLDIPDVVAAATEEYRAREDWLSNFIDEKCQKGSNLRVGANDLYFAYKLWANDSGEYVKRVTDFNAAMEAAGYHQIRPKNKRTWEGIKLDNG